MKVSRVNQEFSPVTITINSLKDLHIVCNVFQEGIFYYQFEEDKESKEALKKIQDLLKDLEAYLPKRVTEFS